MVGYRFSHLLLFMLALAASGCNPRVVVRKNPADHNTGIRYYRPKPYLLITPFRSEVEVEDPKGAAPTITTRTQSDQYVNLQLDYLPDFEEEYAIKVLPGLGKATVNFKLEDGWNLTEMSQDLDSQFDENLSSAAEMVSAVGSIAKPTAEGAGTATKQWVVKSTNVPIGYYESIVNRDSCGHKRLYGWRYVGFAPFNSCPTHVSGATKAHCSDDPNGPIYGLVFEHGVIMFKQLNDISPNLERETQPTGQMTVSLDSSDSLKRKIIDAVLRTPGAGGWSASDVEVTLQGENIIITLPNELPDSEQDEIKQAVTSLAADTEFPNPEVAFKHKPEAIPVPDAQ